MTERARRLAFALPILVLALHAPLRGERSSDAPSDEELRRFVEAGPALLLPASMREAISGAGRTAIEAARRELLRRDLGPETGVDDLEKAIERRRDLASADGLSSFDDRWKLRFLHGQPLEREVVDCGSAYRPLELWRYAAEGRTIVLVQRAVGAHYVAWRPTRSKRELYQPEMEYLLEQWEELRGRVRGKRPDHFFCDAAGRVDDATGVSGLFGFDRDRITDEEVDAFFEAPADLGAWVRGVLAEPGPELEPLPEPELRISFPRAKNQRLVVRFRLNLPPGVELAATDESGGQETRIGLTGAFDRPEGVFDEFQLRFVMPKPAADQPVRLQFDRLLRPRETFVARFELRDELSGRRTRIERGFTVPVDPVPEEEEAPPPNALGRDLALTRLERRDAIVLLPPVDDVVIGLWRAEAIVLGDGIDRVDFLVDGKTQLSRRSAPWSAELRLPVVPEETIVRVEGRDAMGEVVAADELLLNEPRGEPGVRILAPPRGREVSGDVKVRAAVVVPDDRRVESVEILVNDDVLTTLTQPPWEATVQVPSDQSLTYLTVVAHYTDGSRVEDFRVLNSSEFVEQIQVDLVELYVTVTDRQGRLVEGLAQDAFTVKDNGTPQKISRFELVRDLPLTLGLVLDTSGSMESSLVEAKQAAQDFLAAVVSARDRCFAVGFAERPILLMPLTPDVRALELAFRDLPAMGSTSLHDAIIYSLYQFRGVRGRKAMVLLSDGDDTVSIAKFEDALRFAQRSGVAIYTIGLDIGKASLGIRGKLEKLAEETGGRTFFVSKSEELAGVYEAIEKELRSQYFVAFAPDPQPKPGERHDLDVDVRGSGLKARSARGYTP